MMSENNNVKIIESLNSQITILKEENEVLENEKIQLLNENNAFRNEIINTSERLNLLSEEIELLNSQKITLTNELEEHHKELVYCKNENNNLSQQLNQMNKEYKVLKMQYNQMESDRDEVAQQALEYSEALSKIDAKHLTLREDFNTLINKDSESTNLLTSLKNELKELHKARQDESYENFQKFKLLEDRIREIQSNLLHKQHEYDSLNDTNRKLKREYQSTRQDAEAMLQVMSGLEKQISEYSTRESQMEKIVKDCKIQLNEAISSRDQALKREQIALEEIQRLLTENQKLSLDAIVAVEKETINIQLKCEEKIEKYEREMKLLIEKLTKSSNESQSATRDYRMALELVEKLTANNKDEINKTSENMKLFEMKYQDLVIAKEEEIQRRLDIQEANKDLRLTIEKLRSQIEIIKSNSLKVEKDLKAENCEFKDSLYSLQRELSHRTNEVETMKIEINDLKQSKELYLQAYNLGSNDEVNIYRQRATDAEKAIHEIEESCRVNDSKNLHLIEKLKEISAQHIEDLENELEQERNKQRVMAANASLVLSQYIDC